MRKTYGDGTISVFRDDTLMYRKVINGKRVSVYGKTEKELIKKMKEKEKQILGDTQPVEKITLSDSIYEWLETNKKPMLKYSSYDRLLCTFNHQIKDTILGNLRLDQIKDIDINNHIKNLLEKNYSHSTTKKCYDMLNEFFRYKFIRDQNNNPMLTVVMPPKTKFKEIKEIEFLDDEDIKLFIEKASELMISKNEPKYKYGFAFISMIYTGLRAGEMIALQWKDIDFENKVMIVNKSMKRTLNREDDGTKYKDYLGTVKNNKSRIITLNDDALSALLSQRKYTKYNKDEDYVLAVEGGGCNNITNLTRALQRIEEDAHLKIQDSGLHTLRHTCASLYFRNDINIETIARHLGHSVEVCRSTYIHFVEEQMVRASNKINLNITRKS